MENFEIKGITGKVSRPTVEINEKTGDYYWIPMHMQFPEDADWKTLGELIMKEYFKSERK